jgi:hypothetical protein
LEYPGETLPLTGFAVLGVGVFMMQRCLSPVDELLHKLDACHDFLPPAMVLDLCCTRSTEQEVFAVRE